MSKPSLSDFLDQPEPVAKRAVKKTQMKHITVRMPHVLHRRVLELTIDQDIKIQAYIIGLIEADFQERGLPVD
jgi:hypothetical protein